VLEEKSGLEQRLIQVAKDFIEENSSITGCPICSNVIQRDEILASLEDRMGSASTSLFQGYVDSLKKLKSDCKELEGEISTHKAKLASVFSGLRESSCARMEKYQADLERAHKLRKTGKIVDSWLTHLEISIDLLDSTIDNLIQSIKTSPLFMEGQFSEEFYMTERTRNLSDLENLKGEVTTFNRLYSKYSFEGKPAAIRSRKEAEVNIQDYDRRELRFTTAKNNIADIHKSINYESRKKEIELLKNDLAKVQSDVELHEKLSLGCTEMNQSMRRVVGEETESLLDNYGETIKTIYSYLNPHAHFADINLRVDGSSNPKNNRFVIEAIDGEAKAKMNPSYTFSAAQTNVLAISIFMGIALRQQWSNLNALFLDDPIQNMDDINVHSFVDIIRSVVRDTGKQMFISTHDERVFNFMRRKFREDAQIFKFTGYGEFEKW
jgi:hypothetical protein